MRIVNFQLKFTESLCNVNCQNQSVKLVLIVQRVKIKQYKIEQCKLHNKKNQCTLNGITLWKCNACEIEFIWNLIILENVHLCQSALNIIT